ncbi:hypothetical protein ACQPW3_13025 [Actinosynnema sp. CA-248983]
MVNVLASWLAVVALSRIAWHFVTGKALRRLAPGLLLSAPSACFLHVMHSEALFCAIAFWAYLFAMRRRWVPMGLLLVPPTASRITAVLFVGRARLRVPVRDVHLGRLVGLGSVVWPDACCSR